MEENTGMNAAATETANAADAVEAAGAAEAAEIPAVPEESAAAQDSGTPPERKYDDVDSPILPKGWTQGEELFPESPLKELFDGSPDTPRQDGETDGNAPETPETEGAAEADKDTALTGKTPQSGGEPDYKALYEGLVQKEKDAKDKAAFRRVYQEELEAGMSERWALTAAANAVGGRTFPLTDEPGEGEGGPGQSDSTDKGPDAAMAAVKQLNTLYPELKEIPAEVGQMVKDGVDLISAYGAYRAREDAKTMQALTEENQRLKKALGNTAKAPVRGVSGGGQHQEETDDFLRGFNRDY